jgi:hypothetical protein
MQNALIANEGIMESEEHLSMLLQEKDLRNVVGVELFG